MYRIVPTILSSALLIAAACVVAPAANAQTNGFGTSTAGRPPGTPTGPNELHRHLRAELRRRIGRIGNRLDQFWRNRFWTEQRCRRRRSADRTYQSDSATVRRNTLVRVFQRCDGRRPGVARRPVSRLAGRWSMTRLALAVVMVALLSVGPAQAQASSHSRHAVHAGAQSTSSAGKQAALRSG